MDAMTSSEVLKSEVEIVPLNADFPNSAYGLKKQRKELDDEFHELVMRSTKARAGKLKSL